MNPLRMRMVGSRIFITLLLLSILGLVLMGLLLPDRVTDSSSPIIHGLYKMAGEIVRDIGDSRSGYTHPLPFSLLYFFSLAFAIATAVTTSILVVMAKKEQAIALPGKTGMSTVLLVLSGAIVLSVPFLPILPFKSSNLFSSVQFAIEHSRLALILWSLVIYVGYFGVCAAVLLSVLKSATRR